MLAIKNNSIKIHKYQKRQQTDCNNVCHFIATQECAGGACFIFDVVCVFDKPGWHGHWAHIKNSFFLLCITTTKLLHAYKHI